MSGAALCGVALLVWWSPPLVADVTSKDPVEALVSEAWRRVEPETAAPDPFETWHVRLTPPFPMVWPPVKEPRFDYYAYAYRIDPGLADAERRAAPWARIRVRWLRDEQAELELLTEELRPIGVQGVRPLEEREARILEQREEVEERVLGTNALPQGERAEKVKSFYCLWLELNGQVADGVSSRHASFVRWLGCRQAPRTSRPGSGSTARSRSLWASSGPVGSIADGAALPPLARRPRERPPSSGADSPRRASSSARSPHAPGRVSTVWGAGGQGRNLGRFPRIPEALRG